jgi:hypothetical protein
MILPSFFKGDIPITMKEYIISLLKNGMYFTVCLQAPMARQGK